MTSTENRDCSYFALIESHGLGEAQEAVLRVLFHKGSQTDKEIAFNTNLSLSCVNGRRNELIEMGLVAEVGERYDPETQRNVTLWGFVRPGEQSTQQAPGCIKNARMKMIEREIRQNANEHQKKMIRGWLDGEC